MKSFEDWPKEASIVARILAGYGELEYRLALIVGYALWREDTRHSPDGIMRAARKGLRLLFHRRGELPRLELAEYLVGDAFVEAGLEKEFAETAQVMEECRYLRNTFAHCHFVTLKHGKDTDGLYFFSFDRAVRRSGTHIEYAWEQASQTRLEEIARYFEYALNCLAYLDTAMWHLRGGNAVAGAAMPTRIPPPARQVAASAEVRRLLPRRF
jgi:hypothetical protein